MAEETYESHTKGRKLSRSSSSRWSKLHDDILVSILNRLSSLDVLRFSAVCTCWFKVVQSQKSSSSFRPMPPAPWLMLPLSVDQGEEQDSKEEATDGCCFSSLEENKLYKQKKIFKGFGKSRCIGSSHGWLVLLDEKADPYLLNPLTRERIQLPSLNTLEDVVGIDRSHQGIFVRDSSNPSNNPLFMSVKQLREEFILKAILSADPFHSEDFAVIVIYNKKSKIAFWRPGNIAWKDLNSASGSYNDIICKNNLVFALTNTCSVPVWNISEDDHIKQITFKPFFPEDGLALLLSLVPLYRIQLYLVESERQVLLVVRIFARFVNKYGMPVSGSNAFNIQHPYRTLQFHVYKLDFNHERWVRMDSLGDRVLFLGGNHSSSLSTQDYPRLKRNSIYFTDDNWDRINHPRYGGHDLGIFNLEKKSIKPASHCSKHKHKIQPPPFWFVPNPWPRKNMTLSGFFC